ncbi:MAG: hypothetical protein LBT53_08445 [Puniceicoccales bacterium]|nr:hypothetical protein [Puniceicoccales bacterium]
MTKKAQINIGTNAGTSGLRKASEELERLNDSSKKASSGFAKFGDRLVHISAGIHVARLFANGAVSASSTCLT